MRPQTANDLTLFGLLLLAIGLAAGWFWCRVREKSGQVASEVLVSGPSGGGVVRERKSAGAVRRKPADAVCRKPERDLDEPSVSGGGDAVASADDEPEESERLVEAFCREIDRWTRREAVSVDDVRQFVRKFSALPQTRKSACLHRAMNLIPDSNVMLLAGILFDSSQPKAIVKEVFDDVVNRSEEVKESILKAVCQDKSHPCCDDARWIFEVTGEVPR